jgi:hypothetical protein
LLLTIFLSYEGYDYPSSLPITYPDDVHLIIDPNSVHYNVPGPVGDAAWRTVFPRDNEHGIVRLGPKGRAFGLAMFHELKCLNIIRLAVQSVHDEEQPSYLETNKPRVQHCMDYLRHTVLCRADTTLQNLENEIFITESSNTYVCKDWAAVYDVVNNNGTAPTRGEKSLMLR